MSVVVVYGMRIILDVLPVTRVFYSLFIIRHFLSDGCPVPLTHCRAQLAFEVSKIGFTILVYNGDMRGSNKIVRQSVSLPADTARRVRSLAKQRRLSANRVIVELLEEGIEAQKRKQKEFFELAGRFREATDPKDVQRLGNDLGRMVFGD
jgi:hypothetical protein